MEYYQFKQILNGNFENIPKEKSKTVRIFLSSTFSGESILWTFYGPQINQLGYY